MDYEDVPEDYVSRYIRLHNILYEEYSNSLPDVLAVKRPDETVVRKMFKRDVQPALNHLFDALRSGSQQWHCRPSGTETNIVVNLSYTLARF